MPQVVIVGAGLAGLACATRLGQAGIDFRLLEATERVGGRLRTDVVDRFQLDHGFQFLCANDPFLAPWLDDEQLRLRKFASPLYVRTGGQFQQLPDDAPLPVRSRFWERMLRRFADGQPAVPAEGMAAVPRQLAERLPRGSLALEHTVVELQPSDGQPSRVQLSDGRSLEARVVVLATESPAAQRLTNRLPAADSQFDTTWDAAQTIYFAADAQTLGEWPAADRGLLLAGEEDSGPIHHVALLSRVAAEYAPPDRTLVSVSLAAEHADRLSLPMGPALLGPVCDQLRSWFGPAVDAWQHLRTYSIPYAAPAEDPGSEATPQSVEPFGDAGPIVCGDHREEGTMAGALSSGARAAAAVQRRLRQ